MLFAAEPGRNAQVNQEDRIIPHLGVGGSWTTEITLVNVWGAPATVDLRFFDGNGMPLNVPAQRTIMDNSCFICSVYDADKSFF